MVDNALFVDNRNSNPRCQLHMLASNTIPPSPTFVQNSIYLAVNKFASGPKLVNPEDAIEIDPDTAGIVLSIDSMLHIGICKNYQQQQSRGEPKKHHPPY